MKILIVEDDPDIGAGLRTALSRAGYYPEWVMDGLAGQELALYQPWGLILLDWMLPGKSGEQICRTLRHAGIKTPILMITARDAVGDRVKGLDEGADDYLVKPFAVEELLARVRALARRESAQKKEVLHAGDLVLDTRAMTVTKAGEAIHLTSREYALLEAMMRNPGRVFTREAIMERIFNSDEVQPNTVNFHVSSLRKKVDPEQRLIRTMHGLGYVLESA